MWAWVAIGLILVSIVFVYALCRVAALADLHAMAVHAAKDRKATDPWEEPRVGGGIYDHERRGDFDGR